MTTAGTPARLDRAALERVLQRATELQAAERDVGEGLTADEVLALGREVGIPAVYLRQALLEDQVRTPSGPTGLVERVAGPAELLAMRVVRGEAGAVERALLEWMQRHELLTIQRQQPGRIVWERLSGLPAGMKKMAASLDGDRTKFMLQRAEEVRASITPLEDGYVHVQLSASLRSVRSQATGGAMALVTAGVIGGAALAAVGGILVLSLAPVVAGGLAGTFALGSLRPILQRTQVGLERALDHVEGAGAQQRHALPPRPTGVMGLVTEEVRRALGLGEAVR